MSADGSGLRRVTSGRGSDYAPTWSPDGTRIAFTRERSGVGHLYAVDSDGGGLDRVTAGAGDDRYPAWSPGGSSIAFTRYEDDTGQVYLVEPDGTGERRLTSEGENGFATWSPDGSRLAFVSTRDEGAGNIYLMNSDGSNQRALAELRVPLQDLAWSPDGTRVAFASNLAGDADDDNDLYVVDAEGENFATLVRGPGDDETPAWRPTRGNTPPIAAPPPPPPESGGAVTSAADLEALSDPDRTMQILSAIESGSGKRVRRASCDVTARTQRCAVTFADSSCEIWSAQTEDGSLSVSRVARACG